ncbi:MAG: hypothetical protein M0D55_05070 [Elusimicrobiota bacterium]|nr:MAG: hypothetical protein M0D55_05070 [Elusimicrobiota bacterium]
MRTIALAVLLFAACSRPSGGPVVYSAPDGSFSAALPGGWKVDDMPGESRKAAFFGPGAEMIRVALHANATPESYRASRGGLPTPLVDSEAGRAKAREFLVDTEFPDPHSGPKRFSSRVVLLPTPGGLFVLEHAWPAGTPGSKAVFDDVLRTFKPKAPEPPRFPVLGGFGYMSTILDSSGRPDKPSGTKARRKKTERARAD